MKHLTKRLISVVLLLALMLTLFPMEALAEGPETVMETPVGNPTYTAETSLGTLLTHTLEEEAEGDASFPGAVTDLRAEGKTVTVDLSIDRPAQLVVAIYTDSESDVKLLGSGETLVESGKHAAAVSIEIDAMPQYFVAAAYLLDPETHEPLSDSYVSRWYTAEFQAFLQTTTEDYDQDLVLNLDNDDSTNFLVFGEDVLRFTETPGVNELTDNGNGTYTIRKADARFRALKAGDSFAYTFADGTMLIVVAASVTVSGTTVTVTEDTDATLDAVFSYFKIDTENVPGEAEVNMSNADSGVVCTGVSNASVATYAATNTPFYDNTVSGDGTFDDAVEMSGGDGELHVSGAVSNDFDFKAGTKLEFSFKPVSAVTGTLSFSVYAVVKVYKSGSWKSTTLKADYAASFEVEIAVDFIEIQLGDPSIPMSIPILKLNFPLALILKVTGKMTVKGEFKGTFGYCEDSDYGRKSLTSWPSFESSVEFSASAFIGFKVKLSLSAAVKKLVEGGISVTVGANINAKRKGRIYEKSSDSQQHDCYDCFAGDVTLSCTVKAEFSALFGAIETDWKILDVKWKLADFYYSKDFKEFGWNKTCPHIAYKVTAEVYDKDNNIVAGAFVRCGGKLEKTDENGKASFYLPNGEYTLNAEKGSISVSKSIHVKNSKKSVRVDLSEQNAESPESWPTDYGKKLGYGSWGSVSWTYYEGGMMVISGSGSLPGFNSPSNAEEYSVFQEEAGTLFFEDGITEINGRGLEGYKSLKEMYLSKTVTTLSYTFDYIPADAPFTAIRVSPDNPKYSSQDGLLYTTDNGGNLNLVRCPSGKTGVVTPQNVSGCYWNAFENCKVSKVVLPSTMTWISGELFLNCVNLREVVIPNGITGIGYRSFEGCEKLQKLNIPDSVTKIETQAFKNCKSLTSVKNSKSLTSIGKDAFYYCKSLTGLAIPNTVSDIGERAFGNCSSLKAIKIPDGITRIRTNTFYGCSSLESVTLPVSVTQVDTDAFYNCISIKDLYYGGTPEQFRKIAFFTGTICLRAGEIHYNSGYETNDDPILALPMAAFVGESGVQDGLRLASFQGLVPGGAYVLVVTADENAEALLAPANLLYISQATADADGRLTLGYIPRLESVGGVKLYGASPNDLSQAAITVEQFGDGECRVTVSFGGTALVENQDYLLTTKEEGLSFTATVTGRGDYSGRQSVEGQKLAVTVRMEDGEDTVRRAKLLGESYTLPAAAREGLVFLGWSTARGADTPEYLAGDGYGTDADAAFYAVWTVDGIDCVLPAALREIGKEAFCGCAFTGVRICKGAGLIGSRAFAGSAALRYIFIPASVTAIADDAFDGIETLTIYGAADSAAETCAAAHGFTFVRVA